MHPDSDFDKWVVNLDYLDKPDTTMVSDIQEEVHSKNHMKVAMPGI